MPERLFGKSINPHGSADDHWLSVSDLMAGLMMVFLFISIVLMRNALLERDAAKDLATIYQDDRDKVKELANRYQIERDKIKEIAAAYQNNKVDIYNALIDEFKADLPLWDAEIHKDDLSFNFKSPDVLFGVGEITLNPKFKEILDDFFPRYLEVIAQFKSSIQEIRIEGHTSSKWNANTTKDEAYFNNMDLSQGRTRSVLFYIYRINGIASKRPWIKANIAAVGYSSSKLILTDGAEDGDRSRRVTFKLVTNSETQILRIINK